VTHSNFLVAEMFYCIKRKISFGINLTEMDGRTRHENIGCSFKFPVKVGVEESIVNAPRV
jgi:hypothetical protein